MLDKSAVGVAASYASVHALLVAVLGASGGVLERRAKGGCRCGSVEAEAAPSLSLDQDAERKMQIVPRPLHYGHRERHVNETGFLGKVRL